MCVCGARLNYKGQALCWKPGELCFVVGYLSIVTGARRKPAGSPKPNLFGRLTLMHFIGLAYITQDCSSEKDHKKTEVTHKV